MERLNFARVCVKVSAEVELPSSIRLCLGQDSNMEMKSPVEVAVRYQWKPIKCRVCQKFGHATSLCNSSTVSSKVDLCSKQLEDLPPARSSGDSPDGISKGDSALDPSFPPADGDGQLENSDLSQHAAGVLCDSKLLPALLSPAYEEIGLQTDASSFVPLDKAPAVKVVCFAPDFVSSGAPNCSSCSRRMALCSNICHPIVFRRAKLGLKETLVAPLDAVPIVTSSPPVDSPVGDNRYAIEDVQMSLLQYCCPVWFGDRLGLLTWPKRPWMLVDFYPFAPSHVLIGNGLADVALEVCLAVVDGAGLKPCGCRCYWTPIVPVVLLLF
ncbi:hypothetical protein Nepgr_008089 [Nepenthes gracilis]|uniref:Uncharacterized protein n=1 Tax=Nepenthes gracilis TaxID=150966 RepID=A0AAD3S8F6_NEPGR|nr:hypothetical protein Nepgr_008089 [Nepenthes gracilis]